MAAPPPPNGPPVRHGEVIEGPARPSEPPGRPPFGPGVRVVRWSLGEAEAGRLALWVGLGLVALGVYLVLADAVPGVAFAGSLAIAVLGGAILARHLAGRAGSWSLHLGAILAGFGVARLAAQVLALPAAGWGTLGAGLGLLAVGIARAMRGEGLRWQAWLGAALAVFGGWGALGIVFPGFPTLGDLVVPLALVLIGVAFLRRGVR